MGGARLRAGALADAEVITRINARTVPVWVDVRREEYPDLPALRGPRAQLSIGPDGRVGGFPSYYFHVRSFVVSADGERLLNPEEGSREFPSTDPAAFLGMLERSLARDRAAVP